ncbi:hypothetical protein GN157_05075 [Flavobacterium rakeshii]|uniref:DUF4595 domain-containing protein n=1 Tax=Flavobacterium rakeshii TaxID=1038845 RepID=A0A6N8HCT7_9FLAO|nr:hypothetical protein [Flavobacterium rakeshii]MUV03076.1 hypothetical protein [Flavobacterium rakeshii]
MKLRLLALSFFIVLMSCSSDDSTDPVNENPTPEQPEQPSEPVVKNLLTVEEEFFSQPYFSKKVVTNFEGNKPVLMVRYNEDNSIMFNTVYTYNENGSLESLEEVYENGTQRSFTQYQYDESGNIILITWNDFSANLNITYDYVYNNDNTVSCTRTNLNNNTTVVTVFYLNENNLIYKIMEETDNQNNIYTKAEYDNTGKNISTLAIIDDNGTHYNVNCSYEYSYEVKGDFFKRYKLHGNQNNIILINGSFDPYLQAIGYISTIHMVDAEGGFEYTESIYNYNYEFDNEGFPIVQQFYLEGIHKSEINITYE